MTRVTMCLLLLLACSGCSQPDPKKSRLATGQEVLIYSGSSNNVCTIKPKDRTYDSKHDFVLIKVGVKVRVVLDNEDVTYEAREVLIHVLEGEWQGATCAVRRNELRPLP